MAREYIQIPDLDLEPEEKVNANSDSLGQGFTFAHIPSESSGLVVRIGGGPYEGVDVDGADLTCTNNATNYIVAARADGALSVDTATTDWDDVATYGRVGRAVFASGVLTYLDARDDEGGIWDHAAAGGFGDALTADPLSQFAATTSAQLRGVLSDETGGGLSVFNDGPTLINPVVGTQAAGNNSTLAASTAFVQASIAAIGLSGFRYVIELANTTASDPGAGLLKFNNATLASVTALYLDDSTSDGVDLSTLLGSLGSSGLIKITSVADVGEWRVYKWTAAPTDNTGWWTFTVVDQAGTGTFEDGDEVQVIPLQLAAGGAAIGGSTGSNDNALLRADGTGGSTLQPSGIIVNDSDQIHGYLGNVNSQSGTTYTLDVAGTDTDSGKIIDHANGSAITVTLPATAPVGFCCTYVQAGAGQITFSPAGSATLVNRQSHTKTAGQNAGVTLYVRSNAGSAAVWVLLGDTAS